MQITIFSVIMTVLWSSILISIFYVLRVKLVLTDLCSVSGVIALYLFCIIRMLIPVELPWTRVVADSKIYNKIFDVLRHRLNIGVEWHAYQLMAWVWLAGAVFRILCMLCRYRKVVQYFGSLAPVKNGPAIKVAGQIAGDNIPDIVRTPAVVVPCCIGVFRKRILIPEKSFSEMELYYII